MVNANRPNFSAFRPRFAAFQPRIVFGVDFSGAALAGRNAWIAELRRVDDPAGGGRVSSRHPVGDISPREPAAKLRLVDLQPLGRAAGGEARETVYPYLVNRVLTSESAIWGMDFPFGLPVELGLGNWPDQLRHVADHDGDAKSYGRHLVDLARQLGDTMHIRRRTDRETKTPFDCYHYRIIYQTFHGMRDVLAKIAGRSQTLTLPFESDRILVANPSADSPGANRAVKVGSIKRIVMEACPSSTLKRLGLPHRNYKQSGGQPPTAEHRGVRREILKTVLRHVELSEHRQRVIMRNPGGDALDAVIAGLGVWHAWQHDNHASIASDDRYPIEGRVYC